MKKQKGCKPAYFFYKSEKAAQVNGSDEHERAFADCCSGRDMVVTADLYIAEVRGGNLTGSAPAGCRPAG